MSRHAYGEWSSLAAYRRSVDEAAHEGVLAGLEALSQAGGLFDRDWCVVELNAAAHACLGQVLELRDGRLAGRTQEFDRRLQALFTTMARTCNGFAIFAQERGPALVVRAKRLPAPVGRTATILIFTTPDANALPTQAAMRELFGLTAAESCIALDVARGCELRRIASERGVSLDTVRSHLRIVFAKTRTRRQAALVALIGGLSRPV